MKLSIPAPVHLLIASLFLLSCKSTQSLFSLEDKEVSMEPYLGRKLTAKWPFSLNPDQTMELTQSIQGFLWNSSGLILSSDDERLDGAVSDVVVSEEHSVGSVLFSISGRNIRNWELGPGQLGQAVQVTKDGYYLTARHVIEGFENQVLVTRSLHITQVDGDHSAEMKTEVNSFRVVYSNAEYDFAILKANIEDAGFPFWLKLKESPLSLGDIVFAGGWANGGVSAGSIFRLETKDPESKKDRFTEILSDAPLMKGDSGGALIDEQGYLCGILIATQRKPKKLGLATILEPKRIWQIIDEDRQSQHGVNQSNRNVTDGKKRQEASYITKGTRGINLQKSNFKLSYTGVF